MPIIESFDPVIGTNPKVLILGSMPGVASLQAQQYYAHPRNAFWSIMSELLGIKWQDDYPLRIQQLKQFPIVLWDVLQTCRREGSLDSAIANEQHNANDIADLLQRCPEIHLIAFNGGTAEKFFKQSVAPEITDIQRYARLRLPSTSPAHASKTLQQKLQDWSIIKQYLD